MRTAFRFFGATLLCCLGIAITCSAQRSVSGVVTDAETKEPLPGAFIILSTTGKGTATNLDGRYEISIPESSFRTDTLLVSFVGYRKAIIPIAGRESIDVALEGDKKVLDEVVVTAIGISKEKRKVGYAVTDVDASELEQSREVNLMNALNAKVAGVQVTSSSGSPGASTAVRIRGNKSISGNNDPLYIVDGVPVDNSYRGSNFTDQSNRVVDLNPDDIANITVLKGGAASALYGVRAANGAIIITTKRGRSGKTSVQFSSSTTLDQVNKLPQKQLIYGQGEQGEFVEGSRFSWGPEIQGQVFDAAERFFRTGITLNNHLSLQGGSETSDFYLSLGNTRQNGIVPLTNFNRTSLKLTGRGRFGKNLEITASANFVSSNADRGQRGSNLSGVMLGLMRAPSDYDLANGYFDGVSSPLAYSNPDGTQRTYHAAYDNPYWSVNKNRNETQTERLIGFTEFVYSVSEHIKLTERLSIDFYNDRSKSYWDRLSNEYADLGGRIFDQSISQRNLNNDVFLSYSRRYNDNWDAGFILGHNYADYQTTFYEIEGYGFIIPDFYDFSNTSIINAFADDYLERQRSVGAYADLSLGFRDYLFLGITARNDWLSNLPPDGNSFFYSSYSLGFNFTELWNPWASGLDYGKLRVSYANTGNGAPRPYLTSNYFVQGESVQGQLSYLPNATLGNLDLEPENTASFEIGTDMRFWQNRIGLDLTWYSTSTTGQIIEAPIASSSGYTTQVLNVGEIRNWGIEALLNMLVLENEERDARRISWETSINFTRNRNNVASLTDELDNIALPSFGVASTQSRVITGMPYGVLFGSRWLRDANGNVLIDDSGYPIRDTENGVVGDPNPDWLAGWRNSFAWRNWSFSFLWDIRVGGDMYNGTANVMRFLGTHEDTANRNEEIVWEGVYQSSGEQNTTSIKLDQDFYSRYGLTYVSEEGIEEVNWLRLRDLSLSYRFQKGLCDRLRLTSMELSLITRNLVLFTNYSGIDPETSLSGAANSFGRDYFNMPNTRSYGFNLKITL